MSEFKPRSQIGKSASGAKPGANISHRWVIARELCGGGAGPKPGGRVCLPGPGQQGTWPGVGIAAT